MEQVILIGQNVIFQNSNVLIQTDDIGIVIKVLATEN